MTSCEAKHEKYFACGHHWCLLITVRRSDPRLGRGGHRVPWVERAHSRTKNRTTVAQMVSFDNAHLFCVPDSLFIGCFSFLCFCHSIFIFLRFKIKVRAKDEKMRFQLHFTDYRKIALNNGLKELILSPFVVFALWVIVYRLLDCVSEVWNRSRDHPPILKRWKHSHLGFVRPKMNYRWRRRLFIPCFQKTREVVKVRKPKPCHRGQRGGMKNWSLIPPLSF